MIKLFKTGEVGQGGFTLVEMIVAVALGVAVLALIAGTFVKSVLLARRAVLVQSTQENTGFVLELMAKEIRVSTIATANTSCPALPAGVLTITHPVNGNIEYSISGGNIHRKLLSSGIDTLLNSANTKVARMGFCVSGNALNDDAQPRVSILMTAESTEGSEVVSVDVQTTVSQRFLSD